jgi:DNA-binding LacI/PurR family transcriptional regulator
MLVIIEEHYKMSVWCREILDGLRAEARKKRISLWPSSNISDIRRDGEDPAVIIVGSETEWLNLAVTKAKEAGKHPIILSNQSESELQNGVSRVTEDIFGSMGEILRLFAAKGYQQIALYACNPDSASDSFKKEAFLKSGGLPEDIFTNEGSLSFCFDRFYEHYKEKGYGGIVCANDFAAVSLLVHLRSEGVDSKGLRIAVHSNARLLRYFPEIISAMVDYTAVATAAFEIAACIENNPAFIGMRITVDCLPDTEFEERGIFDSLYATAAKQEGDALYTDGELCELMRIERLMSECDETDVKILRLLSSSADEIAENTFLSDNGVKYRIKKMKRICCVDSKREIPLLLAKYGIVL